MRVSEKLADNWGKEQAHCQQNQEARRQSLSRAVPKRVEIVVRANVERSIHANSLVVNGNLVSKVYFPRLIVPTAAIMVAFVDFAIGLAILAVMMVWYRFAPGVEVLLLVMVPMTKTTTMDTTMCCIGFKTMKNIVRHIVIGKH